ncbi:hypothetical protein, partial [Enterobacter kobei]|uniref:hypothetical protein n=1 Tax=Enterobacter kobei TaxID=208224 RepID=UPI003BEEEF15
PEGIPAAADIVNLRYKSCPEMEGQDHMMQENLIKKNYLQCKLKTSDVNVIKKKMKKRLKLSRHSLAVIEQSKIDLIDLDKIWEKWELCIDRFKYFKVEY